jgi:hypothetical protein
MKKKSKAKKAQDMPEFAFKEYTPEESKIYDEAVNAYREAVAAGKTLRQAYDSYSISDEELKAIIQADFLKILIAERHFAQSQSLEQIAKDLNVPGELIRDTHARMLQEAGITAMNQYNEQVREVQRDEVQTSD